MSVLCDLRQFPGKVPCALESVCPLLQKSPALTSTEGRKEQVRNSSHISAFTLATQLLQWGRYEEIFSTFNSCLNIPGGAPSFSSEEQTSDLAVT